MPNWIDVPAAARRLGIAERTVRDRIRKGKLIAKKEANRWLIEEASLGNIGGNVIEPSATSAAIGGNIIDVPLERYEALITRLAQLEVENEQYRKQLAAHVEEKRPFWRRLWRRRKEGE